MFDPSPRGVLLEGGSLRFVLSSTPELHEYNVLFREDYHNGNNGTEVETPANLRLRSGQYVKWVVVVPVKSFSTVVLLLSRPSRPELLVLGGIFTVVLLDKSVPSRPKSHNYNL